MEKNRPEAFAKPNQDMIEPEAQPGFIFFPCPVVSMFSAGAPADTFPVLTKALYLLVIFAPDLHMVGIRPEVFVSWQGYGLK